MGKGTCRLARAFAATALAFSFYGCGSAGTTMPGIAPITNEPATASLGLQQVAPAVLAPESGPVPAPQRFVTINGAQVANDQILVKFASTSSNQDIQSLLSSVGSQPLYFIPWMHFYLVSVPESTDVQSFQSQLMANPLVVATHLNEVMRAVRVQ